MKNFNLSTLPTDSYNFPNTFTPDSSTYTSTGDKLCWGSQSVGIVIIFVYSVSNSFKRKLPIMDCLVRNLILLALSFNYLKQLN